jgi:hypothetical protein
VAQPEGQSAGDREAVFAVIASEAKQSMSPHEERMGCFAEPVIGRIRATRWLAMTAVLFDN